VSSKRSRVHPKYKTKYRVKNWPDYDRALVARGDITLWITPGAVEAWRPARTGSCGAQPKFSNVAIETALTLRIVFHLPLRQAEGFLRSIMRLMDLELESPDHTTLSRRGQSLMIDLQAIHPPRPGPSTDRQQRFVRARRGRVGGCEARRQGSSWLAQAAPLRRSKRHDPGPAPNRGNDR
jgi:hypothetical protein